MKTNSTPQDDLVSVIMINFNSYEYTLDCIWSFKSSLYKNFEIIVIDNASLEDSSKEFQKLTFPYPVKWIRTEKNLGFAGANNVGIENATGEFLFFINNDTEITPSLLTQLIEIMQTDPSIGLLSPKILFFGTNIIQYAGYSPLSAFMKNHAIRYGTEDSAHLTGIVQTHYAHGAAMITTRSVVEQCGKMPEQYFLYYEELDWSETIKSHGYNIFVHLDAIIYHKESQSIGKASPLKLYYNTRNRVLFARRNFSLLKAISFYFYSVIIFPIKSLLYLLQGQYSFLRAYTQGIFWHLKH